MRRIFSVLGGIARMARGRPQGNRGDMSILLLVVVILLCPCAFAGERREPPLVSAGELSRPDLASQAVPLPEARFSPHEHLSAARPSFRAGVALVKFSDAAYVSALRVEPDSETAAVSILSDRPDVAFSELDRLMSRQFTPNDPSLTQQWHHTTINSTQAWDIAAGGASVRIGIVDYVFQMDHPDLAANTDNGWDVVNETVVYPSQIPGFYPYDDHSTLSAGLAAGVLNNGVGISGAGNCRVLPIRIDGYISEMYDAIVWAASNHVRVVNISWDGADSSTLNDAGQILRQEIDGILLMAGVNGTGYLGYPDHPYITCISMTDTSDALKSRYGPHIDFAAPGWDVYGTTTPSTYGSDSGTSFSTPLMSGIVAALLAIDPSLSAADVLTVLENTSVDLASPGKDLFFGWGRVDFYAASWLAAAMTPSNKPPFSISQIERTNTAIEVSAEYHRGLSHQMLRTDDLVSGVWTQTVATVVTNDAVITLRDETPPVGPAFYRLVGDTP